MTQIRDLTRALGDFAFADGRGGILVHPGPTGVQLYALSPANVPRHWTNAELSHLAKILPKMPTRRLGRATANEETRRRIEYLQDRRKEYQNLVSLDPDGRPIPVPGATVQPDQLPRLYAGVHPETGTLAIFGSEYPIPNTNLRGDELVFELDLDDDQMKKLKSGGVADYENILRSARFSDARVLYYDDNLPITGKQARTHNLKSIKTLDAFTAHIVRRFEMSIIGNLTQMAQDEWLEARTVSVAPSGQVNTSRLGAQGRNFSMTVVRGVHIENGKEISRPTRPLYTSMTFVESMASHHQKVLRDAMRNFANRRVLGRPRR